MVSPSWQTRTYSANVSWIHGQAPEIGYFFINYYSFYHHFERLALPTTLLKYKKIIIIDYNKSSFGHLKR